MNRMRGKTAIVTGGAVGIGRACALKLAEEGAAVTVTDLNARTGSLVIEEIRGRGGDAIFVEHDVADEAKWEHVMRVVIERYKKLDVLVNNAGVALARDVEHTTLEEWRRLMSINLDGVFLGTKHAIRAMKATRNGSIVNLSSIEGLIGDPNLAAYNASKGGVRLLASDESRFVTGTELVIDGGYTAQ